MVALQTNPIWSKSLFSDFILENHSFHEGLLEQNRYINFFNLQIYFVLKLKLFSWNGQFITFLFQVLFIKFQDFLAAPLIACPFQIPGIPFAIRI